MQIEVVQEIFEDGHANGIASGKRKTTAIDPLPELMASPSSCPWAPGDREQLKRTEARFGQRRAGFLSVPSSI